MRGRVQCKEMPAAAGTVTMAQLQRWLEVMAEPQYLEQVLPTYRSPSDMSPPARAAALAACTQLAHTARSAALLSVPYMLLLRSPVAS